MCVCEGVVWSEYPYNMNKQDKSHSNLQTISKPASEVISFLQFVPCWHINVALGICQFNVTTVWTMK
eukprot:m.388267 g.388267  ORF g.388267 m.388267 type:complete len:67 (-) comp167404_c0_seq1:13-213(-)